MSLSRQVHNQRYGGMSNDEYIATQPGSFFDCANVDVRRDSKSFCLATGAVAYIKDYTGGEMVGYYGDGDSGYGYTIDGNVIRLSDMATVGSVTGDAVQNIIAFKDQTGADGSFLAGQTKIHKHIVGGAVTSNIGVYSPGTFSLKSTFLRPLVKSKLWIYIGDVDGVARYAIDTQIIDRPLVLEKSDVIRSIVELGDQIIIFTTNGSNGRQYFRDGVSKVPNRMIERFANPCYFAAIFKNQIYVLTKNGLYVSDGYNSQLLYRTDPTRFDFQYTNNPTFLTFDTSLDIFYFAILGPANSLMSYGERLPGFGKSFVRDSKASLLSGLPPGYLSNFQVSGSDIYYTSSVVLDPKFVKLSGYASNGYIETIPMIGDGFDQLKKSKKIRISYNLPDVAATGVKVYVKYDDGVYVQLFQSSASNSTVGFNRRTILETGDWYKRQIKIELTTTDPTKTPKFYQITSLFDTIQDDAN